LAFERAVVYLGMGNYCFKPTLSWGINRGRGINRENMVVHYAQVVNEAMDI